MKTQSDVNRISMSATYQIDFIKSDPKWPYLRMAAWFIGFALFAWAIVVMAWI